MSSAATIEAFDAECLALTRVLQPLTSEDLMRPTNCPPWTLHELVVHIADSIRLPDAGRAPSPNVLPPGSAADYYRRPERDSVEYRVGNVERTRQSAAKIPPDASPALFNDVWQRTSHTLKRSNLDQRIDAAGRAITLEKYVLTRLMSVAAHGLDVAITLSRPAWTTRAALRALRPVLVDLLSEDPPLDWTDLDLLELGTGRRPLTAAESEMVGPLAARFPLLS